MLETYWLWFLCINVNVCIMLLYTSMFQLIYLEKLFWGQHVNFALNKWVSWSEEDLAHGNLTRNHNSAISAQFLHLKPHLIRLFHFPSPKPCLLLCFKSGFHFYPACWIWFYPWSCTLQSTWSHLRVQVLARGGHRQQGYLGGFLLDAYLSRLWRLQPSILKLLFKHISASPLFPSKVDNWTDHIIHIYCQFSASLGTRGELLIPHKFMFLPDNS